MKQLMGSILFGVKGMGNGMRALQISSVAAVSICKIEILKIQLVKPAIIGNSEEAR